MGQVSRPACGPFWADFAARAWDDQPGRPSEWKAKGRMYLQRVLTRAIPPEETPAYETGRLGEILWWLETDDLSSCLSVHTSNGEHAGPGKLNSVLGVQSLVDEHARTTRCLIIRKMVVPSGIT